MRNRALRACLWIGFGLGFVVPAAAADRTAKQITADIEAIKAPDRPEGKTREDVLKFLENRREADIKKAALILELYQVQPDDSQLIKLLPQRWMILSQQGDQDETLKKELNEIPSRLKNDVLKVEATYVKATLVKRPAQAALSSEAIEEFLSLAPKDKRGAMLLWMLGNRTQDKAKKAVLEDRILKDYPESPYASRILDERHQREGLGKPFELAFTEAIHGSEVSIKGLKGKVVVIDFWATWCGPCVAEMPKMKELYAKYKGEGVEFIGVSLDSPKEDGGLDKLKKFVAENEIGWPQYYQGNGWNSEFSKSWHINAIPSVFVVDSEGKLASIKARGKLEQLIPELLNKPKTPTNGE